MKGSNQTVTRHTRRVIVDVEVLVPEDRLAAFQIAIGAFAERHVLPKPPAGASAATWRPVKLALAADTVTSFYGEFAGWLRHATAGAPKVDPPDLDAATFGDVWDRLYPRHEREALRLLADDFGRTVGWPELKTKLGLSGDPALPRDLPVLAALCAAANRRFPIRQDGTADLAVFSLPAALIDLVEQAVAADDRRSHAAASTDG
jgi:hypothetical protein